MYKRKLVLLVLIAMILSSCASMANLQESWNKLTPNNKARIVVGGFQDQLNTLFDIGKSYVEKNPDKLPIWKSQIIPAFDTANKAIRGYIVLAGQGNVTLETLYKEVPPIISSIIKLLTSIGVTIP